MEKNYEKKQFVYYFVYYVCRIFAGCAQYRKRIRREYHIVKDMAGNDVKLPVKIERVSCMSATCETALVAMGQSDKMICTSTFASGEF